MIKPWTHLVNPFLVATEKSYLKALNISTFHDSALYAVQNESFFTPLYNYFHPLHLANQAAYSNWVAQKGMQTGDTLNLTQLLKLLLSTKIGQWDIAIQVVHPKNTSAYQALLHQNRKPFQTGKQAERISAVQSLGLALTGDTALASVKNDVDAFYQLLDTANTSQKSSKTTTNTQSDAVESARVDMCTAMYSNLGAMIQKFASNPDSLANYFDLHSIRNAEHVNFSGHIKPLHIHSVCKHTFAPTDSIEVNNTGAVALNLYLAHTKDAVAGSQIASVAPGADQIVPVTSLGNLENNYLIISNADANIVGEWEVTLI